MVKPAGRPPFKPTATQRRLVRLAAGAGLPHVQIAAALAISQPTLRKAFAGELGTGGARAKVEVVAALHASALRGSAAAARAYLSLAAARPADLPPTPKLPRVGKKETAAANAVSAAEGTDWESLLPPVSGSEVLQ